MIEEAILSTAYLGPVQYFTKLLIYDKVEIEQFDTYQKQTYRNRCRILGTNGPLDLSIPVIKTNGNNTLVKDIRIDYAIRWQMNHWRSIVSAYNSSPFLEYYIDDFQPFFHKKWDFLIDFNQQLLCLLIELIELDTVVGLTTSFEKNIINKTDFRNSIHPKPSKNAADIQFLACEYTQTFSEKMSFYSNLSIIDLLFNKGPETVNILLRSIVKGKESVNM